MENLQLESDIVESKKILDKFDKDYNSFSSICSGYLFTNENVKSYLSNVKQPVDRALSVIGSGDQIFNLIQGGTLKIDGFDINRLSYYIFWFKVAVFMSFDREKFLTLSRRQFCFGNTDQFLELLEQIKNNMTKDVYDFFYELANYQLENNRGYGLVQFLRTCEAYSSDKNNYAKNDENYKALQRNMEEASISFYFDDARVVTDKLSDTYSLILLSNITDYLGTRENFLTLEEFKAFIKSFYGLLEPDGILINYFFRQLHPRYLIQYSTISELDVGKKHIYVADSKEDEAFLLLRKHAKGNRK